jgi:FkbM family methyltransferase
MFRFARIVLSDFFGLTRVAGPVVSVRWLLAILLTLPKCFRQRNLQPADLAMGHGPFAVRLGKSRAKLAGEYAISGAREIWVRQVYMGDGFLEIKDGATVVDLGSNMGNFSALALGHGPRVRLVAVEADPLMCDKFTHTMRVNGWEDRAQLVNGFVGGTTQSQVELRGRFSAVPTLSEQELLDRAGIQRIDFLKVDIEGSEFELLTRESRLLAVADQLAIELHTTLGDADAFLRMLEELGFELGPAKIDAVTHIQQARRRRSKATAPTGLVAAASA